MNSEDILRNAWHAGHFYVRNRSVAFCFEYAPNDIEGGSGVCLEIANRLFIATSAHNFDRLTPGVNWSGFSANRSSNHRLTILRANYRQDRQRHDPDVAWLEIDRTSAENSDLVGIDLADLLLQHVQCPDTDMLYLTTGFPSSLKQVSQPTPQGHRDIVIPFGMCFTTAVAPQAGTEDRLVVLDYEGTGIDVNGQVVQVEPFGMSGGGIWYAPANDADQRRVWDPRRLKLVGLNREYFSRSHYLTGEPMQTCLSLLRDDLPELRAAIDPLVP